MQKTIPSWGASTRIHRKLWMPIHQWPGGQKSMARFHLLSSSEEILAEISVWGIRWKNMAGRFKNLGFRVLEEKILKKKTTCGFLPTALVNFLNGGHNLSYVNMGSARMCMVAELMKSIIECMNEWILENSDFTIGWLFTAWDYKLQNSYSRLFNMGLRESILNPMFFSPHWAPLPHHHLEHPAARLQEGFVAARSGHGRAPLVGCQASALRSLPISV